MVKNGKGNPSSLQQSSKIMRKTSLRDFDYKEVAHHEAAMWRAYYQHSFLKLFIQLSRITRSQLRLNWFVTLRLAYHSAFAAMYYRVGKGDKKTVVPLKHLTTWYRIISKHSTRPFDYKKAAQADIDWWDLPRYPGKSSQKLQDGLASSAGFMYNTDPKKLRAYAQHRTEAMYVPTHENEGDSRKTQAAYQEIETLLEKAWSSLHKAVQ